jgi:hypothetical protein
MVGDGREEVMEMEKVERGDGPRRYTVNQKVCGALGLMLANPNVQSVVIDRQPGQPLYVLAFSVSWNELRAKVENGESLTNVLVIGGPVERGKPRSTFGSFEVHDWYYHVRRLLGDGKEG